LTGKPIEDLFPGGYLLHVEAQGPCCDTCGNSCADLDPTATRDELYNRIVEHTFLGGISILKYVAVTKVQTTVDGDAVVGIKFESAFVDRTTDTCYFNIFPYNADPIHIQVSEYNPDWHGNRCESTFPVTVLQTPTYPMGSGQWLMRYEAMAKNWDGYDYSEDMAVRLAERQFLNTDPTLTYDKYTLVFEIEYNVLGWSDVYHDRYDLEVFVPTGQTAFKNAINTYITSAGIDVATV